MTRLDRKIKCSRVPDTMSKLGASCREENKRKRARVKKEQKKRAAEFSRHSPCSALSAVSTHLSAVPSPLTHPPSSHRYCLQVNVYFPTLCRFCHFLALPPANSVTALSPFTLHPLWRVSLMRSFPSSQPDETENPVASFHGYFLPFAIPSPYFSGKLRWLFANFPVYIYFQFLCK